MLNGPLYQEDDGDDGSPGQAAADTADSFADSPTGAVSPCVPNPDGGTGSGSGTGTAPAWTQADIKANLDKCDGGTNVWAKAKAANGGKDPTIQEGHSSIGSGGSVDTDAGAVTIDPGKNKCEAKQIAVQELTNLSHKADFNKVWNTDCPSGNISREDYIRANEKIEYDGVHNVLTAFNACKAKWGCGDSATCIHDGFKGARDFDDYYAHYLAQGHKDYYGKFWDSNCKAAWDAKHPPATAPGGTPPSTTPPKSPTPTTEDSGGNGGNGSDGSDGLDDA